MAENNNQIISTLLPNASIAVYSTDGQTLDSARNLINDWRFARVNVLVEEGNTDTAIEAYEEMDSPDLLLIQTDIIDESFTAQLEALAAHCSENTAAVVIGPENDVNLYRRLIDMGVSDYLVKPVEPEVLANIAAKSLVERLGTTNSSLIAVIGAKGGVGTSNIAQMIAWCSSSHLDQKTMLADFSGGHSALPVGVGFEPIATLSEAVRAAENNDEDSLKRMVYEVNSRFSILASGNDIILDDLVDSSQLETLINTLMMKFPVCVVDVSGCTPKIQKMILSKANHIALAAIPTVSCLRLGRTLIQEIKELRGGSAEDISLIMNMIGFAPDHELSKNDIETALDLAPKAFFPFLPKSFVGVESEDSNILSDAKGLELTRSMILPILQAVLGVELSSEHDENSTNKSGGLLSGLIGKMGGQK